MHECCKRVSRSNLSSPSLEQAKHKNPKIKVRNGNSQQNSAPKRCPKCNLQMINASLKTFR